MENKPMRETIQRIIYECQESGATKWEIMKVLKQIEKEKGRHMRKRAIQELEQINPGAAKTLKSFERLKVFTSSEKREPFDRGNIIKSLLNETKISRAVAEKIGSEVEDKIKDLELNYLNTQVIREMVNVKLLEYGHESIHNDYARIGIPVSDVDKKLKEGLFENQEIMREYNWLKVIPKKIRELHFDSLINIHSPEHFSTKILFYSDHFEGNIINAVSEARKVDMISTYPATMQAFNFTISQEKKTTDKEISEKIERIKNLMALFPDRICENALYSGEWNGKNTAKENAIKIANGYENKIYSIDSRFQLKLIKRKNFENSILLNNNKEKVTLSQFGPLIGSNKGVTELVAINLLKLIEHTDTRFFETLTEIIEELEKMMETKKQLLEKRKYMQKILERSEGAICFSGLLEASEKINKENPEKIAEQIISLPKKQINVLHSPEEITREKFGYMDDLQKTQEMLGKMGTKAKRNFGFIYSVKAKESESKAEEYPAIIISG